MFVAGGRRGEQRTSRGAEAGSPVGCATGKVRQRREAGLHACLTLTRVAYCGCAPNISAGTMTSPLLLSGDRLKIHEVQDRVQIVVIRHQVSDHSRSSTVVESPSPFATARVYEQSAFGGLHARILVIARTAVQLSVLPMFSFRSSACAIADVLDRSSSLAGGPAQAARFRAEPLTSSPCSVRGSRAPRFPRGRNRYRGWDHITPRWTLRAFGRSRRQHSPRS